MALAGVMGSAGEGSGDVEDAARRSRSSSRRFNFFPVFDHHQNDEPMKRATQVWEGGGGGSRGYPTYGSCAARYGSESVAAPPDRRSWSNLHWGWHWD